MIVSIDFTDVTLVSEDTYQRLPWYDHDTMMTLITIVTISQRVFCKSVFSEGVLSESVFFKGVFSESVFSVTRRSRSDEGHLLTELLTYWVGVLSDFTDVTLVREDTFRIFDWCDPDDSGDHDDLSSDESDLVMKFI